MKTLIMIGAGHGHLVALELIVAQKVPNMEIILISDVLLAPYSGMLPGFIAGYYNEEEITFNLKSLAQKHKIKLIINTIQGIDTSTNTITLSTGEKKIYDCLSINIGILPQKINGGSDEDHLIYVKPLSHFIPKWNLFLKEKKKLKIAVIGAGSAGYEVATAIALKDIGEVRLFSGGPEILLGIPESARNKAHKQLIKNGIKLELNSRVESYSNNSIHLANGQVFESDYVFVCTGAKAQELSGNIKKDNNGFILTDNNLRVKGTQNVFAAGDCIHFDNDPLPKAGVYAVRQGSFIAKNILAFLGNQPLATYVPQKYFLKILMTGKQKALATKGVFSLQGKVAWILKEYLDRSFMKKYQTK